VGRADLRVVSEVKSVPQFLSLIKAHWRSLQLDHGGKVSRIIEIKNTEARKVIGSA